MLFSTPALRAVNLSIAVLVAALAGVTYWYAWRPLPETSGEISAPISGPAAISRDALGVPHIQAATWQDAIFLQGYATAQDRMWQMDALRRLAGGELAEVIGRTALAADQEARRLRLSRVADEQEKKLSAGDRALLDAYARGVNFYLETHRARLPLEFTLLNYSPRPWTRHDTLLCGLEMYRELTTSWRHEIEKLHMLEKGDRAKVEFLYPPKTGFEIQPGSNAWAISGAMTASGKPILANDPHLEFSMPSTWHMVHLRAPGLNVSGVALPGVPAVIIGHNDRIAWGVTNLQFDVQDLYREKFEPQNGHYVFQNAIEQARLERSAIAIKGAKPQVFEQWITRHGPIYLVDEGQSYALRWTAADADGFQFPFFDIDRAGNWDDFKKAIARFPGPGQNFVYADVDGNIGYHATGHLPIRPAGCGGDVPADGATGACEWQGYIPFDDLPWFLNPARKMVVTANQNPFPADYQYPVAGDFAASYRAHEIATLLARKGGWKAPDMLAVEKDVYSDLGAFLAGQIVAAYDNKKPNSPQLGDAVDSLRQWSGQMEKGTAAPMLVELAYRALHKAVADRAAPDLDSEYTWPTAPQSIEKLLRERPQGWFPDYDALLIRSLGEGIEEGAKIQGSKISRWDYGQFNDLRIPHPVLGQLPLIGKYFDIGPVPMSGSGDTIKQTTRRLGPSMRMIVDLSNLEASLQNITIGESGQPLSPHYKDQWKAYYGATSFPMQFQHVSAKSVLSVRPE